MTETVKEQHDGWRVLENGQVQTKIRSLLDGWWIAETPGWPHHDRNRCYRTTVRQVVDGEYVDLETFRGPFPTRAQAEEFQYRDYLADYWEAGMAVFADHCLGCGAFAKVLAFDSAGNWAWRVTECRRCGVLDSRLV
jgi:hypothetical protein